MKMLKTTLLTTLVAGTIVLQGCAGFRANSIPVVTPEQLKFDTAQKTKVYSRWDVNSPTIKLNDQTKVALAAMAKKQFEDQLKLTNCCVVVESLNEADVVINATSHNENNPAAMMGALLTGFSLYTIPSWVTINFHVSADVKKGDKAFQYDTKDSMKMVQWLPMALMFPFANPFPMEKAVGENVQKTLIANMKKDGVL